MNDDKLSAEAIEAIRQLAVKAAGTEIVIPLDKRASQPIEPPHVYYMRETPGGPLVKKKAEVEFVRRYAAKTVDAFVGLIKSHADPMTRIAGTGGKFQAMFDDLNRREWVRLELVTTPEFEILRVLAKQRTACDQRAFIVLLAVDLRGCLDETLVNRFRALKFSRNEDGETVIDVGSETMGRRVKQEVVGGGGGIPEEVEVTFSVYRTTDRDDKAAVRDVHTITCLIDTNLDDGTFRLLPNLSELEQCQVDLDARIVAHCGQETGKPAFVGSFVD